MKPAFSVVFLTTLSGAGQGLLMALFGVELAARMGLIAAGALPPMFFIVGAGLAVLLGALGLLASFFHLGHPERAWRAIAMWRTSFGGVNDFGLGSAIAVFLFLLVIPILLLNVRRFRREV